MKNSIQMQGYLNESILFQKTLMLYFAFVSVYLKRMIGGRLSSSDLISDIQECNNCMHISSSFSIWILVSPAIGKLLFRSSRWKKILKYRFTQFMIQCAIIALENIAPSCVASFFLSVQGQRKGIFLIDTPCGRQRKY